MRYPASFSLLLLFLLRPGNVPAAPPATPPIGLDDSAGWLPLFNGRNLDNFYTWRINDGKNNDPEHAFKIENGMIHILDIPTTGKVEQPGYLATNDEFRNYRFRLEYKWGDKKYPLVGHPSAMPGESGLLYHIYGPDCLWPRSIKFQIQDHNTGDIWLLNTDPRPSATTSAATTQPDAAGMFTFAAGGAAVSVPSRPGADRIRHNADWESPTGWNTIELVATGDQSVQIVNGHVASAIRNIHLGPPGPATTQGRLALQADGNEVYYRNVQIKPLFAHYNGPAYKVLVFSKTAAFRHASIPQGLQAIRQLGAANNFLVDATEDSATFTDDNLSRYKAIIFLSTTGDILNDSQKQAMENFIHHGGGYVGIHAAADTEYHWPWYEKLVGAWFANHPPGTHPALVQLEDADAPSTSSLPLTWTRTDEWYNFRTNPRLNGVHVLATLDESTYTGGTMHGDHPISWSHEFEGGRSWYTAMGHTNESFHDPLYLFHILGGIEYAANIEPR